MFEQIYCNICGGRTEPMQVREQMLGLYESFVYYSCIDCGHTHLGNTPDQIEKYYNTNEYYSFKNPSTLENSIIPLTIKRILFHLNLVDNILFSRSMKAFLKAKRTLKRTKVLDYGCGSGYFVKELHSLGFRNAMGFDPFLPVNQFNKAGIFLSNDIELLPIKKWDIITLNHVLEHLTAPIETLKQLNNLANPGGLIILRIPVIDSYAFKKYRENWAQFDAPRHLNLFTRKSITIAIEKAKGFKVMNMYDDSYHFQFTGSELYLKNKTLSPEDNNRIKRILSLNTYKYHFLAKKLNKLNQGDQIVIILKKT